MRRVPELLEREDALTAIDAALDEAVVVVEGPAGRGKSAVLAAYAQAPGDARVLRAAGDPTAREWPFGLLVEALAPAVDPARLDGPAAAAAALFAPVDAAPASTPPAELAAARVHALLALLRGLAADRPLLLVADDLHFADEGSLVLLARLAERGPEPGLRVLAATRGLPADENPALDRLLGAARSVPLAPLSAAAVGELLRRHGAPAGDASLAAAVTGGDPFLVLELAAALREGADVDAALPQGVARRIAARIALAGEEALALATAVAILGRDATVARAARVAELGPDAAATAAARLSAIGSLTVSDTAAIAHSLVARALLDRIGAARQAALYGAAARVLDADGVPAARVATLLLRAQPIGDATAVRTLATAAWRATTAGAPQDAVALYERALVEPPPAEQRFEVTLALAQAQAAAGAEGDFDTALGMARTDAERARALTATSTALTARGRFAEAEAAAVDALAVLPADADPRLARGLRASAALARSFTTPITAADVNALTRPPSPATTEERSLLAHSVLTGVLTGVLDRERARELALWATDDHRLALDVEAGAVVMSMVTGTHLHTGDFEASVALSTAALDSGLHAPHEVALLHYLRSPPLAALGRLDEARADAAAALAGIDPESGWIAGAQVMLAWIDVERGGGDAALAPVLSPHPLDDVTGVVGVFRSCVRAWLELELGRPEDALASARRAGAAEPPGTFLAGQLLGQWRSAAARALVALDRRAEALELVAPELEATVAWGVPHTMVRPLVAAGLATGGEEGLALLERAAAAGRAGGDVQMEIEGSGHLGAAKRRAGRPAQAREDLYAARELAAAHGFTRKAAWIEEELRVAGGRPRADAAPGRGDLTESERRVAERAAAGARNKDIAQELFLSTKTVEFHLSNAYRKLGVRSRGELRGPLGLE